MSTTHAQFKKRFCVNWTSLLAGFRGFGRYRRLVTLSDIDQFASDNLALSSDSDPQLIKLIDVSGRNSDQVEATLVSLAERSHSAFEREVRKWTVCLLEEQLHELPDDPLYGLLCLTDFWCGLDFPAYSPHQVQGRGNNVDPLSYYTAENYWETLRRHKQWIENETREAGKGK